MKAKETHVPENEAKETRVPKNEQEMQLKIPSMPILSNPPSRCLCVVSVWLCRRQMMMSGVRYAYLWTTE
jgi:hypothetical protein